jgi:hypothetical protein
MIVHSAREKYFQRHHMRTDPNVVEGYKHVMPDGRLVPISFCGRSVCTLLCTQHICEALFQYMPLVQQHFCVLFAEYHKDRHVPSHLITEVPIELVVHFRNVKQDADPDSFTEFTKQLDVAKIDHHNFLQGCTAIMFIPFQCCYDSDVVPVSGFIFGVDISGPCRVPVADGEPVEMGDHELVHSDSSDDSSGVMSVNGEGE